jgi:hypothetical protein
MNYLYTIFILFFSGLAFGQIQQNVNKISGTESSPISVIDSIRFNGGQMEIIFSHGGEQSHNLMEINNVTFSEITDHWPNGTVHCGDPTEIVDVTNPITGATWMDRNLGASQVATTSTDENAYGDLYQWGRAADGHQCRNSSTTSTISSSEEPRHADFILTATNPNNWLNPADGNLWQGVNDINNPCPTGFRIPTEAE